MACPSALAFSVPHREALELLRRAGRARQGVDAARILPLETGAVGLEEPLAWQGGGQKKAFKQGLLFRLTLR